MALTVGIPFAAATNASLVTADMQSNRGINNVHFDENICPLQVEKANGIRTKSFLRDLEKSWKTPGEEFVLKSFLQRILEMPDTLENRGLAAKMQETFFKQQGYLARMFSKETWEEWTENRTELGRVVFELKNCLESQTRVRNCVNKLDPNDLEKANEQAKVLLNNLNQKAKIALTPKPLGMPESLGLQTNLGCLSGILGGTAGSFLTNNPVPFLLGVSECFPGARAVYPITGEFRVQDFSTTFSQTAPSVAAFNSGNFIATWNGFVSNPFSIEIFGQLFNATGHKIGNDFLVNNYTADDQERPSSAVLSNDDFVVTWESDLQDGSLWGVYGQLFNGTGYKIRNEFQVNTYTTNDQLRPSGAVLSNGDFVVTWSSDLQDGSRLGVYGQIFSANAAKVGSEFQVNSFTALEQDYSSVTGLRNGNFIVTWQSSRFQDGDDWGIFGQVFDGAGAKIGSEFQVNTYFTRGQIRPSVASLSNGNFVITWASDRQDGSSLGTYGQLFDETGSKIGNEFQVNDYTFGSQWDSSVAALGDGGFVATWMDSQQESGSYGIFGRLFNSTGSKVESEFHVNTYTRDDQQFPSVAALSDRTFVVIWQSHNQDGPSSFSVYGRIFSNGTAVPTTTTAATGSSSSSGATSSSSSVATGSSSSNSATSSSSSVATGSSSSNGTTQAGTGTVSSSSRLQGSLLWLGMILGMTGKVVEDLFTTHWPMGKARIK